MSSKLVVVGSWFGVAHVFQDLFNDVLELQSIKDLEANADSIDSNSVVLFGGGADISPSLYNQKALPVTGASDKLSSRDAFEKAVFEVAISKDAKFLGVCRGAQLLCAFAGGSLFQHVDNHAGQDHKMETSEGTVLSVSSAHHQMMNPTGTEHVLLGWSHTKRSNRHISEKGGEIHHNEVEVEPEAVFFPKIKALALQYHPEFMSNQAPAVLYSRKLVSDILLGA